MKRSEAIELLEKFQEFGINLMVGDDDQVFMEDDIIDKFLESDWAKEKLPINNDEDIGWKIELPFCANKERCGHWTKVAFHPSYKCYTDKCPAFMRDKFKRAWSVNGILSSNYMNPDEKK